MRAAQRGSATQGFSRRGPEWPSCCSAANAAHGDAVAAVAAREADVGLAAQVSLNLGRAVGVGSDLRLRRREAFLAETGETGHSGADPDHLAVVHGIAARSVNLV